MAVVLRLVADVHLAFHATYRSRSSKRVFTFPLYCRYTKSTTPKHPRPLYRTTKTRKNHQETVATHCTLNHPRSAIIFPVVRKGNTEGMSRVPLRRDRHYSVAGESSHDGVPSDRLFTPRETCYRHEYARIQRTRLNHEPIYIYIYTGYIYIYVYIVSTGPVHRYVYTNREQLKREIHQQIVDPRES